MAWHDFITAPIASIAGGLLGLGGAQQQNQTNEKIASARNAMEVAEAAKARDFSASQSQIKRQFDTREIAKQLNFQERMSSTAVQRRMQDMKAGGINPILAGKFEASSPAGGAASAGIGATAKANAHGYTAVNKIQPLLDNLGTALQLKKLTAETKNIEANTGLTGRKTDLTDPVNRLMNILDNVIQGGTNNPKSYMGQASKLKNEVQKQVQELKQYATGQKRKEARKIRKSPGIELTPNAKKRLKNYKGKKMKKSFERGGR